ncbi:MAG: HTTM domain-containing protein, partial [Chitinophagaceae bacterium]|nr:HTTM domain-containing protein [Chitinophagaceae bacterium]
KSHYNNHYYLMVLIGWMMTMMPANRRASMDVKWKLVKPTNECHRWQIQLFIIQIAIVYIYASIAKMYPDWLNAVPVKLWFSRRASMPFFGRFFGNETFAFFISYSGIIFDLLIVPALLWRRTRILAVAAMLFFHFFNGSVFGIGVFPYLAMSLNVFFFPGKTFDNVLGIVQQPFSYKTPEISKQNMVVILISMYVVWQVLTPLRHHLYKGDVTWTEEGHRMSWRMMLRTKSGRGVFKVKDKNSDSVWVVRPNEYLMRYQANDVAKKPDFIWQFSKLLKSKYKEKGYDVEVYAECFCSLNGRPEKPMVDPNVDIAAQEWKPFTHHNWVMTEYE